MSNIQTPKRVYAPAGHVNLSCCRLCKSVGDNISHSKNRPLHGFRRHLGCGAVAAKITANVWEILQLSTLITPQLHVQF